MRSREQRLDATIGIALEEAKRAWLLSAFAPQRCVATMDLDTLCRAAALAPILDDELAKRAPGAATLAPSSVHYAECLRDANVPWHTIPVVATSPFEEWEVDNVYLTPLQSPASPASPGPVPRAPPATPYETAHALLASPSEGMTDSPSSGDSPNSERSSVTPSPPPLSDRVRCYEKEYRVNRYPSKARKKHLAVAAGQTLRQTSVWFQNRRQRDKKKDDVETHAAACAVLAVCAAPASTAAPAWMPAHLRVA